MVDLAPKTIQRIENGEPTKESTIKLIEDALGIELSIKDTFTDAYLKALNQFLGLRKEVLNNVQKTIKRLNDIGTLEKKLENQCNDIEILSIAIKKHVEHNKRAVQDQKEYNRHRDELIKKIERAETEYHNIEEQIENRKGQMATLNNFLESLKKQKELITTFEPGIWSQLVDHITVYSRDRIEVQFRDGTTINVNV